jgi:Tol biopolymer transport system component
MALSRDRYLAYLHRTRPPLFVLPFLTLLVSLLPVLQAEALPAEPTSSTSTSSPQGDFTLGDLSGLTGNILFSATIANRQRILVLDLDGRRIRTVIDGPGNNSYPSWSPDGREFVFVSDRGGKNQLYVARWDGANVRRLTQSDLVEDNPHWGRGGNLIAYSAQQPGKTSEASIMIVTPSGEAPRRVTKFSGRQTVPKLSPDGTTVSYSTNRFWPGWDVCVIPLKGQREQCVLSGAHTYCRQDYAPDGKSMAYSSGLLSDVDLGVLDTQSGKMKSLTSMPGREYDATFSPDGRFIAFTAEDGRDEIYNLYLVDPEAKARAETRALVISPHSIRFLSWTDAQTIDLEAERLRAEDIL